MYVYCLYKLVQFPVLMQTSSDWISVMLYLHPRSKDIEGKC